MSIENDLKETADILSANWQMQTNAYDARTNFIYSVKSLDECLDKIRQTGVQRDYALHRWYNYMTSVYCEYIFCEFGAVHEKNKYNHDVDIYIDNIPFDVKLTVYPAKLSSRPYDLQTREGKDSMIRWFYTNQSQENRKQLLNRIYVVCDAKSPKENLRMKCDFDLMRSRISEFMQDVRINGCNEITIEDNGIGYNLKSDIVYLAK